MTSTPKSPIDSAARTRRTRNSTKPPRFTSRRTTRHQSLSSLLRLRDPRPCRGAHRVRVSLREARARLPLRFASILTATSSCASPARWAAGLPSRSSPTRSTNCSSPCPNSTPWPSRPNARGNNMSRPLRFGPAASAIALASILAGCAAPQQKTGFGGKADENVGLATRAMMALNAKDLPTAIDLAERAVEKSPDDAGFRALLGNAYFAAGRFWSAESAYKDSLSIYSNQPQVILKLALIETALGKKDEALAFLQAGRSVLDASNYGLALALAGHPADAVPILESAAREPGADATIRQNLALAHALAGDWTEARTIAAQDVPANKLDERIQQWMQLASPKKPADQVAALVGVTPAAV